MAAKTKNPSIRVGYSEKKDPKAAVEEIYSQIRQEGIKFVIFFVPAPYDQIAVNEYFREKVPSPIPILGCSSLRVRVPMVRIIDNITPHGFKEAIVAMSIASDDIEVSVRAMRNIKENWEEEAKIALFEASKDLGVDPKNTDPKKYFGILLCDAISEREEYILETLYKKSNFLFVGGGSCGRHSLIKGVKPGFIHTREGVFNDAAAIAVVRCEVPFKIDMTTSVVPTKVKVKITKAKDRRVYEINGKPAAKEYARLLGVPKFILGTKQIGNYWLFTNNPFGLMVKDRAFIRDVAWREGNMLMMGCNAKEGEELYLMKRKDIVNSTKKMISRIISEMGEVSGVLAFQCGYRFFEAYREKKAKQLFEALNIAPIIGLNSYGEYYGWASLAQTLTVIAFGKK